MVLLTARISLRRESGQMKCKWLLVGVCAASMSAGCMSMSKPTLPSLTMPKVSNPLAGFRRGDQPTEALPSPDAYTELDATRDVTPFERQLQGSQDAVVEREQVTQRNEPLKLTEEKPSRLSFLSRFWR